MATIQKMNRKLGYGIDFMTKGGVIILSEQFDILSYNNFL